MYSTQNSEYGITKVKNKITKVIIIQVYMFLDAKWFYSQWPVFLKEE